MICPNCQKENAEGAKFCNHCGAALFERADKVIADSRKQIQELDFPVPADLSDPSFMRQISTGDTTQVRPPAHTTADLRTNPNLGASAPIPFKGESLAPVVEAMFTRTSDDPSVPATPTWDTSPIDFTGFEQLVDSSYVPPTPNAQTGDTLEMPSVGAPAMRQSKDFRAHSSTREEKQRLREEKHQQKALKKAQKREAREAALAMKKMGIAAEPPAQTAAAESGGLSEAADTAENPSSSGPAPTPTEPSTPVEATATQTPASSLGAPVSGPLHAANSQPLATGATAQATGAKKSRIWIPIVIGIIVVIAAVVGLTYYFELWGGKVVPDVIGESEAVGRAQLEGAGFSVRVVYVKSDEAPDTVLLTDPGEGARVPEGGEIVMHVSIARTVPNVVGMSKEEAEHTLDEDGFTRVEFIGQKSDEAENLVLGITPAPDTEARASTPIQVVYAEPYLVPEVAGMTTSQAEAAITDAGLVVKTIFEFTEDTPDGTAISTDPAAGTKVRGGSTVTLTVARSRRMQLIDATTNFLAVGSSIRISGGNYPSGTYVINSLDSVTFDGDDTTSFTITCTPYDKPWFSLEVNFGDPITVDGSAEWSNSGSLLAVSPDIARIG